MGYRNGDDYDKMAQLAIEIYVDYGLNKFPVDEKTVCDKLGIKLVPYSELNEELLSLCLKKSQKCKSFSSNKRGSQSSRIFSY